MISDAEAKRIQKIMEYPDVAKALMIQRLCHNLLDGTENVGKRIYCIVEIIDYKPSHRPRYGRITIPSSTLPSMINCVQLIRIKGFEANPASASLFKPDAWMTIPRALQFDIRACNIGLTAESVLTPKYHMDAATVADIVRGRVVITEQAFQGVIVRFHCNPCDSDRCPHAVHMSEHYGQSYAVNRQINRIIKYTHRFGVNSLNYLLPMPEEVN
jgi:hypothetical protein